MEWGNRVYLGRMQPAEWRRMGEGGEMISDDNKRRLPQLGFLMIRGVKMDCPRSIGLVYTRFILVD